MSRSRPSAVSVRQMQEIDETAIDTLGIPRLLLMDHAGLAVAHATRELLAPADRGSVLVCCGTGHNGGDGLAAGRHLDRFGLRPTILLLGRVSELRAEPAAFAAILHRLGLPIREITSERELDAAAALLSGADAVVDALLGIGLRGEVRPLPAALINLINRAGRPVISADVPSGLDADSGHPLGSAVYATVTVSFGLAKRGLLTASGSAYVGRLMVDPITLPPRLLEDP